MKKQGKIPLLIMICGIVLCCAVRAFMIFCTDMNTGFIVHGKAALCNVLYYGILILTTVGVTLTARREAICEYTGFVNGKSNIIGFATLVPAFGIAYEGVLERKALTPSLFLAVTDFVFAAALVILAFVILAGKGINAGIGFSYSFVGVYLVIRGVCVFNARMAIASVPEYLLDMLCIICGAVFFMALSKYLTGNGGTGRSVCFWGSATAIIGISPAIGAAAMKIFGVTELSERITFGYSTAELFFQMHAGDNAYVMTGLYLVNTLLGAFAAVVTAVLLSGKKAESVPQEVGDNPQ